MMLDLDFSFLTSEVISNFIVNGFLFSIELTLIALSGGILIGIFLALMRMSSYKVLSWMAGFYINTMRSIPLVMVILWVFLLIPLMLGKPIGANISAIITFTVFEAAYYAEILRSGIQSVPKGQTQAAYAIGMRYSQTMGYVVLPQAFRNMMPVLLTQTIILFQDTSLVYAIGAYDLLKGFSVVGRNFNRPVEAYLVATAVYFCICFALSMLVRQLQNKIQIIH
jgi:glutamate/aspartate transport system permease protein